MLPCKRNKWVWSEGVCVASRREGLEGRLSQARVRRVEKPKKESQGGGKTSHTHTHNPLTQKVESPPYPPPTTHTFPCPLLLLVPLKVVLGPGLLTTEAVARRVGQDPHAANPEVT